MNDSWKRSEASRLSALSSTWLKLCWSCWWDSCLRSVFVVYGLSVTNGFLPSKNKIKRCDQHLRLSVLPPDDDCDIYKSLNSHFYSKKLCFVLPWLGWSPVHWGPRCSLWAVHVWRFGLLAVVYATLTQFNYLIDLIHRLAPFAFLKTSSILLTNCLCCFLR